MSFFSDLWSRLFSPKKPDSDSVCEEQFPKNLPRAAVFVDYEYWFYSYQNLFGLRPDVAEWHKSLRERFVPDDVMIFADFGHKAISAELGKLRAVSNMIIETQNVAGRRKKDMTDFIMLDYIYQTAALKPDLEAYILFTGDGHFQSVVKYLTQRLSKQVLVYGVKDSFSKQLMEVATEYYELPASSRMMRAYYEMIVENMAYVSDNPSIIPSFKGTVQAVCRRHNAPEEMVEAALREMLDQGLLLRKPRRVDFNRNVLIISPDWEALHNAGLWEY